ncbi:hypothetical protein ACLOJK_027793 [Asimina triloba]
MKILSSMRQMQLYMAGMLRELKQEERLLLRVEQQTLVVRWQTMESELVREVNTTLVVCDAKQESILGNFDPPLLNPEVTMRRGSPEKKEIGRMLELSTDNIFHLFLKEIAK